MLSLRPFAVAALVFSLILLAPAARAQDALMQQFSQNEKAAFAFYRLTDTVPDFREWIKPTAEYQQAKPSERNAIMQRQTLRLQQGFLNFYPERHPIRIMVPVGLSVISNPHKGDAMMAAEQDKPYALQVMVFNAPDPIYFPFNNGDFWVALMVRDVAKKMVFPVDAATSDRISSMLNLTKYRTQQLAKLELVVYAKSADPLDPIVLGTIPLFKLSGEAVAISLWTADEQSILWEMLAEGYVPERRKELMMLFNKE